MGIQLRRPPAHRVHTVVTRDGQALRVRDWGPVDGAPVLFHHLIPANGFHVPGGWESAAAGQQRIITFDRPGYNGSPAQPGRLVRSAAEWGRAIADALSLERFAVMGTGGGGPHAAAVAAAMPERVTRLCIAVGVGPTDLDGFDVQTGLPPESRIETDAARRGEEHIRRYVDHVLHHGGALEPWLDLLPEPDVEILSRAEVLIEEQAAGPDWLTASPAGWIDDDLAVFARPWGIDLRSVTSPTLLLYGGMDILVSPLHGDAYRRVMPHASLVVLPAAGHWLRDYEPEVLRWLTAAEESVPDFVL